MALTEQRALSQVTVLPELNSVNVQWLDQILRDGEVIASTPFRKAYGAEQKEDFLAEVDQADQYVAILGW